ncbi:MAG: phosphatidate cytidylyltransferase [Desulfobulbaceae bacterium]|nr:phosphatidate cytidylyltransferase [Desulfobulbaceae bacterium]HIJ78195.1 phosphatidate cytidylyltransferase [Deltaproteobacteria bacterium]
MKRVITGICISGLWLLLLFTSPFPIFWLTITLVAAVALAEYFTIALPKQDKHYRLLLILLGLLPLIGAYPGHNLLMLCGLTIALLALLIFSISRYSALAQPFEFISRAGFGFFYISLCIAHLILLMDLLQGRFLLLLLTAITAGSDTAAYYSGRLFGKHKLSPAISPGKTIEGFIGGVVGSVMAAMVVKYFFLPDFSYLWVGLTAVALSCLGVVGDLSESVIKRTFAVKDSGSILPGHGGVLDRIDSLLLTAPALYYIVIFYIILN